MKIDRDKRGLNNFSAVTRKNQVEVPRKESTTFNDELYQRQEAEGRFRMQELLREMDRLTQRLNKSLTVNDLMLYKKLVKQFLQEAISKAYNLNQQPGRSRREGQYWLQLRRLTRKWNNYWMILSAKVIR